jgi:hypothetical protein
LKQKWSRKHHFDEKQAANREPDQEILLILAIPRL